MEENRSIDPQRRGFPVAIVGMGCRLPRAHGPRALWRLLSDGVDAISPFPLERLPAEWDGPAAAADPPGQGGFLEHVEEFDAGFFGVSPREAVRMDPQQRILLETVWEAFEDAGLTDDRIRGSRTGVFVGLQTAEYWELLDRAGERGGSEWDIHAVLGGGLRSVLSGRIAYAFDLRGPAVSVDTACSSSLVAVHQAVRSIRGGECAQAVVGGTNLLLRPMLSTIMTDAGMLSPDGRCKFGDASADGFVRADGVGAVVLKPLDRALADGDDVYAVIRGTASRNDGQAGGSLMAPAVDGQRETLRAAYSDAGIDPADVDYVEAHGTGTSVGDPVELRALGTVVGAGRADTRPCLVGSLKSNIGHTEGAAGISGLIKAALCLKEGVIPPNLHCAEPDPRLPWRDWHLTIPVGAPRPWPETGDRARVAGVSSFGISGTNAHVVLTGPPAPAPVERPTHEDRPLHLLPLSARDPRALSDLARTYADHLDTTGEGVPLRDVCHSAGERRSHFEHRLAVTGSDHAQLRARLEAAAAGRAGPGITGPGEARERRLVFVFPGQGGQWAGMARDLLRECPEFVRAMDDFEQAIAAEADWSLLELLGGAGTDTVPIDRIQPALVAIEASLARVLRGWGVEPDLVVGHSMGEIAAACAADALSVEDAVRVVCRRTALMRRFSGQGAMLSVALPAEEAAEEAARSADRVSVAVVNAPGTTVLSGEREAIEEIRARLEARSVFCRLVRVDVASHSPQIDGLREELLASLEGLVPMAASVPIWSTTDGKPVYGTDLDAAYWVRNLREPVRFGPVVQTIAAEGPVLCWEISPHPVLLPALQEILGPDDLSLAPLRRGEPEYSALLTAVGEAYVAGGPVSWGEVVGGGARFTRLPTYPWQRERFWYTDRSQGAPVPSEGAPGPRGRPLLGPWRDAPDGADVWEGPVDLDRHAFLLEHRVEGEAIFPGVGYVELLLEAAASLHAGPRVGIEGMALERALFLDPARRPRIRLWLGAAEDGGGDGAVLRRFEVSSRDGDDRTVHSRGRLRLGGAALDGAGEGEPGASLAEVRERCRTAVPAADFYRDLGAVGNQWNGSFQGIAELWRGDGEVLTRIRLADDVPAAGFEVHPCLLDACLQGLIAAKAVQDGSSGSIVGGGFDSLVFRRRPEEGAQVWCHARLTGGDSAGYRGEVRLHDDDGEVIADLHGVGIRYLEPGPRAADTTGATRAVPAPASASTITAEDAGIHTVCWEPVGAARAVEAPATAAPRYVVYADAQGVGEALADRLRSRGWVCVLVRAGEAFQRLGPQDYTLSPGSGEDHRRLLAETLSGAGGTGRDGEAAPDRLIHLWSLDADSLAGAERRGCLDVIALTRALADRPGPALTLVTAGAQSIDGGCPHPEQAPLWGLGRALAAERPAMDVRLVDLDPAALKPVGADHLDLLVAELTGRDAEDQVGLRGGRRLAPRLRPRQGRHGSDGSDGSEHVGGPMELVFGSSEHGAAVGREGAGPAGTLDALEFRPVAAPRRPGHGEVAIEASVASIGFRGVLVAMGVLDVPTDPQTELGYEFSGTVTEVGPGARGFSVGDEVLALSSQPLSNHVVTLADLVCHRPAALDPAEAASVPGPFVTADLALRHLARIRPGERVLVHSAAGGVGLAAVQIARREGAEVLVTAGTEEKRSLLRYLGVTVVGDSRTTDFAAAVRETTGGHGVDVVLNLLSGEPRAASLDLLAPFGRWIELTKQDIRQGVPMDPRPFDRALSFVSMDVMRMTRERPEVIGASLREMTDLLARGELQPLPYRMFPARQAGDAFRFMARSGHTGRAMLSVAPTERPAAGARVRPDAGYLITGGVGDLGLEVARWLVAQGARNLLLVGRSPLDVQRAAAVRGLRAAARVEYEVVDVADEQAMGRVLTGWENRGLPQIRGVVHAAGVMGYADAATVTAADLAAVMRPKAHGALVLDRLSAGWDLDFFVLFSSGSAILPSPLLGAYAAANAYLDALAHHRRARGAAATSVNWGFWGGVGMAARYEREHDRSPAPDGMRSFTPAEALDVLDRLLREGAVQAALLPTDWSRWAKAHPAAARAPFLSGLVPAGLGRSVPMTDAVPRPRPSDDHVNGDGAGAGVPQAVPAVPVAPTVPTAPDVPQGRGETVDYLRGVIGQVLGLPPERVHPRRALNRQGLDSLMAVEIRARVRRDLGVDIPIVRFLNGGSPEELAAALLERSSAGTVPG